MSSVNLTHPGVSRFPSGVRTPRFLITGVLIAGSAALVLPASPAAAKAATLKVEYTFDSIVASQVTDETGRGHTLTLQGSWAQVPGNSGSAVQFVKPSLGSSPNKADLNPGTKEFAVTTVFKLPNSTANLPDTPNIAQKGLYSDSAQWKMQLNPKPGVIECRFKGSAGAQLLSSAVTRVDDGVWHTASCWRSGNQLGVTVDDVTTQITANVGDISNQKPIQVGAKSMTSTSDQFPGIVDYFSLAVGKGALGVSRAGAGS